MTMAPACPIFLPLGAAPPAMKATTGLAMVLAYAAASSSIAPPISPTMTTASVPGKLSGGRRAPRGGGAGAGGGGAEGARAALLRRCHEVHHVLHRDVLGHHDQALGAGLDRVHRGFLDHQGRDEQDRDVEAGALHRIPG